MYLRRSECQDENSLYETRLPHGNDIEVVHKIDENNDFKYVLVTIHLDPDDFIGVTNLQLLVKCQSVMWSRVSCKVSADDKFLAKYPSELGHYFSLLPVPNHMLNT